MSIRHAGCYPCRPDWDIPRKRMAHYCLFYIQKGEGWVETDGRRLQGKCGDLFIMQSGRTYRAGHKPKKPVTVLSTGFVLNGPGMVDALRAVALPDRMRLKPADRRRIEQRYRTLNEDFLADGLSGGLASGGALLRLLAETIRLAGVLPASAIAGVPSAAPGESTRIKRVLDFIDSHLTKPLSLARLAAVVHLTPVYFASLFRRTTGQAPMAYVRSRRIERAKALLADSDDSVAEIARAVGYEDPFYFSRLFRREAGVNPSDYRASFENPFIR